MLDLNYVYYEVMIVRIGMESGLNWVQFRLWSIMRTNPSNFSMKVLVFFKVGQDMPFLVYLNLQIHMRLLEDRQSVKDVSIGL